MSPTHAQYRHPVGNPKNAPGIFQDTAQSLGTAYMFPTYAQYLHLVGIKKTPTA
ncbi:MAG: hypothetical protein V7785_23255 [Bermanella sp.]